MLTSYFDAGYAVRRLRRSTSARYIESFARFLAESGYSRSAGRIRLRTASEFAAWADSKAIPVAAFDEASIARFATARWRRAGGIRRRPRKDELTVLPLFVTHLRSHGVVPPRVIRGPRLPALAKAYGSWLSAHRGVQPKTREQYESKVVRLVAALGENPATYNALAIRQFIMKWSKSHGLASTRFTIAVVRSFIRYLIVQGQCRVGLDAAVPQVAAWRLASLPRYVSAEAVDRIVAASGGDTPRGARNHAVLLLLARLGLRASEVAKLRIDDIAWESGTFTVRGKGRRNAVLPLPQDVGNALGRYIREFRPAHPDPRVFLRVRAPFRPLGCAESVSHIVRGALRRAGMADVPIRGAHLLRHSAATAMLRSGASLDAVRGILRHRLTETTAVYAKVDVETLKTVARPWPGAEVA